MKRTSSLQLSTSTLLELIEQAGLNGESQDPSVAARVAIEFWLAAQKQRPAGEPPAAARGYQWKSLFLPDGTMLRSWSYGDYHYARVAGDELIYEDRSLSPNQFAACHANSVRNAWNDIYIRRPGDKSYKVASLLRRQAQQADSEAANARPVAAASIAAVPVAVVTSTVTATVTATATARDDRPGQGWSLPERRQYRFRLEDVAFD